MDPNASLYQSGMGMVVGRRYRLQYHLRYWEQLDGSSFAVYQGEQLISHVTIMGTRTVTAFFTAQASTSEPFVLTDAIYFTGFGVEGPTGILSVFIDNVSLKEVTSTGSGTDNIPVKEFLTGSLDDGKEIFFRADTQTMQLMPTFETFAMPLAVVTKLQRGSLVKCFVSLDNEDFYELEGNATKGVSIVKIHSRDRGKIPQPPIARKIRISWRDSSAQLCRLTQGAIIFMPTTMDYSE